MNQKYINNEYEILDSGSASRQPRYPLANAPYFERQNVNYKDCLAGCLDRNPVILAESYNEDIRDALTTTLNVTSFMFSVIPGLGPAAAAAAGILSTMVGYLWPTNTEAVWETFMSAVEDLVEQKIDDYARANAIGRLRGVHNVLVLYETAVNHWQMDPGNLGLQETVREQFIATNTFIVGSLPLFRAPGYEVPMLTSYAQAANLHLLLLRDAVKFGASWGMEPATINGYQSNLETGIEVYTNSCVETYNKGLQEAKSLKANVWDFNRYPWAAYYSGHGAGSGSPENDFQNMENWNLFNSFRRDMTLMVLDLVSVWPTYNPKQYPLSVNAQLTREIYTDLRGCDAGDIDNTEAQIIRPPGIFTFFESATINTELFPPNPNLGYKQRVHPTLAPSYESAFKGTAEGTPNTVSASPSNAIINRVDMTTGNQLYQWMFYQEHSTQPFQTVGTDFTVGKVRTINRIPIEGNQTLANHRMSCISGYLVSGKSDPFLGVLPPYISCATLGWTHISANLDNKIVSDKITQIPAVKGYGGSYSVVKGPGSTGGDLVQLNYFNSSLFIRVKPSRPGIGDYQVRIRYAALGNGKLNVKKFISGGGIQHSETFDYSQTTSGNLTPSAFQYLNVYNINLTEPEFGVWLTNESGSTIIIDKIEFIPLTPKPEPPPPGTYQIVTALNNSSVVDLNVSNGVVQLWQNGNGQNQKWNLLYDASKDAYQFETPVNTNNVMEYASNNRIYATQKTQQNNQYWTFEDAGEGYFYIRSKADANIVLDVEYTSTANGTNIVGWPINGGMNQKFKLNRLS